MTTMTTITQDQSRIATSSRAPRSRPAVAPRATTLTNAGRSDAALAVLRVAIGTVFLTHGAQKLFVFGFGGVIGAFEGMGVPLATIAGPAVAFTEFFGGLALIAGLFTRLAGSGLAMVMLGAAVMVHLPAGFFLPNGVEFVLVLFSAAVALVLTGPGALSIDALLTRRRARIVQGGK